jgi:hypothetical protein
MKSATKTLGRKFTSRELAEEFKRQIEEWIIREYNLC